jgi:hypothetical protein
MNDDFWGLSTGEDATTKSDGSFDVGGGNMEPIPNDTSVLAAIDEAKWDKDNNGNRFISLRWAVLQPEDFANRKVFQKLWVLDDEPKAKDPVKKRDKAKLMLGAIDMNAGGKLLAKPVMPTDEALTLHLTNKPMIIKVMKWSMRDAQTGDMNSGNWVGAVSSRQAGKVSTPEEVERAKAEDAVHKQRQGGGSVGKRVLDDEIPF